VRGLNKKKSLFQCCVKCEVDLTLIIVGLFDVLLINFIGEGVAMAIFLAMCGEALARGQDWPVPYHCNYNF